MKCDRCGGPVESKRVSICAPAADPPTIVQDVPAEVCGRCGEQTLTDETVGVFERIRDEEVSPAGEVSFTVYNYDRALTEAKLAGAHTPLSVDVTPHLWISYSLTSSRTPAGEHVIVGPGTAARGFRLVDTFPSHE